MRKPRVSVVIPTLNEEKYLEEALSSIAAQKRPPKYELVIADGGSKDRTLKIAKRYADLIVHEPKRTIAAGRNSGAIASSGQIMVTANADCYYPENWLASLIAPFDKKGVVGSFGKVVPKDGDLVDNAFSKVILHPTAHVLSKMNLHFVASETMAIRRPEFMKVGGFNTDLICGEDTDLVKKIAKHGEVVYAPEAVAHVSMRRVKKWGKIYYTCFHATNFVKMHFLNKAHASYEPIRE